jgi:hypothetical protein
MGARFFARVNCFFVVKLLLSIHFQEFSSDIMLDFFLSSDKEHVCYMILLSFLELTSYKIAVADLLLSWQSHRKQRAVSSVHCIPELSQLPRVFEEALRWDFACGESNRSEEEQTHARRHRWSAI